jgi:hypothetical protein
LDSRFQEERKMEAIGDRTVGVQRRSLVPGDRVVLTHSDGAEELRTVSIGPKRVRFHSGPRWIIYLDETTGWFDLRRVRPA